MSPAFFSHFSIVSVSGVRVSAAFPGRFDLPARGTFGYVRSRPRHESALAAAAAAGDSPEDPPPVIPWRDYPESVLTDSRLLPRTASSGRQLLVSTRNVINEFGHRLRIDGKWWGREGDPDLPGDWPVLSLSPDRTPRMMPLLEAETRSGDLLTGVPLVRSGEPAGRDFLIHNASDVAHSFEVHPRGAIGPSPDAWSELSDAWEKGRQSGLSESDFAARLEAIAEAHDAKPSRNLLHSAIGQRADGELILIAATGSFSAIARELATRWNVIDAIALDNGGSVGWRYFDVDSENSTLLLAGPNHRPVGSCFLYLDLPEFPQPSCHPALPDHA